MKKGIWQSHLNKMRTLYSKKQHTLLASIHSYFGDKVRVIGENSGLHIVVEVKSRMEEGELIQKALNAGVKVYPLSIDPNERPESKVLLGFGGLSEKEIEKGVMLLKEAWGL
jgi:GntR family transcriptional regulator/MocR family aminotransferase